ncbi:Mrp/NBP35 family ATP-binding protein [Dendrosporobacter sp. 1207_IL3150]|uniref:Mrp/NBP35 family ATP-binding protein n=1 Tax=Dendrosporobacter sp. 1207_IL3150 TaxID=3084054 RepID=UPI002FDB3DA5
MCEKLPPKEQSAKILSFLQNVKNKFLIMGGKGGVGKSTIAANLAVSLSNHGCKVGLLDLDLHSPSIPGMLGLTNHKHKNIGSTAIPLYYNENLSVFSSQGLLEHPDQPIILRDSAKKDVITQFLADVYWGCLDYIIIDCPPGADDQLAISEVVPDCKALIITTPQDIALADVRKTIQFCKKVNLDVIGIVENMSGFFCPSCGNIHEIFKSGGGEKTALEWGIPFLGRLPLDSSIVISGDQGDTLNSLSANAQKAMHGIIETILTEKRQESTVIDPGQ